jgi:hypothetical protein
MSQQYDNEKAGVLFRNDKEGNEKRPDYTGKIQFDGVEYRLSAWIKEGKKGKFMSLKAEEFRKAADAYPQDKQAPKAAPVDDFDSDSIPF